LNVKPDPSLTEEQMKEHNVLYARANELSKGLILLDDVSFKPPGCFGKRRLRKAVELYRQVLEINSKNWPSMFAIAKAFQSLGEFQQSLDWFIRAHECVPENPSVAKEVGNAASRLGKHDVALQTMRVMGMFGRLSNSLFLHWRPRQQQPQHKTATEMFSAINAEHHRCAVRWLQVRQPSFQTTS